MAVKDTEVPFELNVIGDVSGERWFGKFTAVHRLSHRLEMLRGRIRREMLGSHPDTANTREIEQALMLAELAVSITKAPKWWSETDAGQDLVDDNVVVELYQKVQKLREDDQKEDAKKVADAAKTLKSAVENQEETEPEPKDEE